MAASEKKFTQCDQLEGEEEPSTPRRDEEEQHDAEDHEASSYVPTDYEDVVARKHGSNCPRHHQKGFVSHAYGNALTMLLLHGHVRNMFRGSRKRTDEGRR